MAKKVILPNEWDCYPHQLDLWRYLDERDKDGKMLPGRRAACVWHRRSGKDSTILNFTACEAMETKGVYFHMLRTQKQAKKVVWDGIDRAGRRIIDQVFPPEIVKQKRQQELQIELINGSIWQLLGSDNYDSFVGANPRGIVFSEWSLCNPAAWDFMRPILRENGGWAVFIYTPRGKNHGWTLAEMAKTNDKWFYSHLTVDDTKRTDGSAIVTKEGVQEERDADMSESKIQQEFYCSFDVALEGAYFAKELAAARADKRICFVPIESTLPVHTFWDLGLSRGNAMAVWFVQAIGREIRMINYLEKEDSDLPWFKSQIDLFADQHNIHYGIHHAPHDINVRELTSGKSRMATAREMGLKFVMVPRTGDLNNSIEATRRLFSRCWFDEKRCERGINGLASYRRKYITELQVYADTPLHDWASNPADAFRQMAQAWNDRLGKTDYKPLQPTQLKVDFDVFS